MRPSRNQLLSAALPKEAAMGSEDGALLFHQQHARTADQASTQEEENFCLAFLSERKPHGLQCILDRHDLAPSSLTCPLHSLTMQTSWPLNNAGLNASPLINSFFQ